VDFVGVVERCSAAHLFLLIVNCTGTIPTTLRALKQMVAEARTYGNHFLETLVEYFTPNLVSGQATCGRVLEYQAD
jgi:hypothetical protein